MLTGTQTAFAVRSVMKVLLTQALSRMLVGKENRLCVV